MSGIDLLFGPMLIGVFLNCMLFGVMVMQGFIYYETYSKDTLWIRIFIAYLLVVETVNTCCDIYLIYQPLVQEFGTPAAVTYFPMMLAATPITTVAASMPVQIFTAWRIKIISGSWIMPTIIAIFSVLSAASATWVAVQVVEFKLLATKLSWRFNGPGIGWFVSAAIADILITTTLCWSLSKRKTGHKSTTVTINRIIRLTIQTGLVTMIFAIADLLLFTISRGTAVNFVWDFALSKLYTNALLSTLNARAGWSNLNKGMADTDNVLFSTNDTSLKTSRSKITRPTLGSGTLFNSNTDHNVLYPGAPGQAYELSRPKDMTVNITKEVETDYKPGSL